MNPTEPHLGPPSLLRNPSSVLQTALPSCMGDGLAPLRSTPDSESYNSTCMWAVGMVGNPKVGKREEGEAEERDMVE